VAVDAGAVLLGPARMPLHVPYGQVPPPHPAWRPVAGGETATDSARLRAYSTCDGLLVVVQSVAGPSAGVSHPIAAINLGVHRVWIGETTPRRFEARWHCTRGPAGPSVGHRLAAGPTTLAGFLALLVDLDWRPW
jgi:hypothetical protein